MATTPTPNFGFLKHEKGDPDWDFAINGNWDKTDTLLEDMYNPSGILYGTASIAGALNTTVKQLTGWQNGAEWGALEGGTPFGFDQSAGTLTVPEDGIYTLGGFALFSYADDEKEQWIELLIGVNGATELAAVFSVATDKVNLASLIVSGTRGFTAGQVISLHLRASSSFGAATIQAANLEMHRRTAI